MKIASVDPRLPNDAAGRTSAMRSSYDRRFEVIQLLMEDLAKACSEKMIEPRDPFQIAVVENIVSGKFLEATALDDFPRPARHWEATCAIALLKGLVLQAAVLVGGLFQGRVGVCRSEAPHEREIFILKDVPDTTTAAATRYLAGCESRPRSFLNLTPGIASCLPSRRHSQILPGVVPLRPASFRDWFKAIGTYLRHALFLLQWLRSLMARKIIFLEPQQWGLLCGHMARGALYWHWGRAEPRSGECYVCTHLQMDAAYLDAALRSRGATTVHWLHGTVEYRYKFFGASSVAVTPTPADAGVLREYSDYARVVSLPTDPAKSPVYKPAGPGPLLLLTNLLHTHHQAPAAFREASLRQLLEIVSLGGRQVIWRPHPSERKSPLFLKISESLDALTCRIDFEGSLDEQLFQCGLAVSTFSGAIRDVLKTGRVPLIWGDLRYESHGIWGEIPDSVVFSDANSFVELLRRAETNSWAPLHEKMWKIFHCGAMHSPPCGFFRTLMSEGN